MKRFEEIEELNYNLDINLQFNYRENEVILKKLIYC